MILGDGLSSLNRTNFRLFLPLFLSFSLAFLLLRFIILEQDKTTIIDQEKIVFFELLGFPSKSFTVFFFSIFFSRGSLFHGNELIPHPLPINILYINTSNIFYLLSYIEFTTKFYRISIDKNQIFFLGFISSILSS